MTHIKLVPLAMTSAVVLSCMGLLACGSSHPVACYGVAKGDSNKPIVMSSGVCHKLAFSTAKPVSAKQAHTFKPYPYDSYVKCYGVAAAGMNDCGTNTTACGGTVHTPGRKDAWVAIPKGVCQQIKNGVVVLPTKKDA